MFLNPGSKDKFASYVQDSSKDILTLTLTDIPTSVDSVVARLKQGKFYRLNNNEIQISATYRTKVHSEAMRTPQLNSTDVIL